MKKENLEIVGAIAAALLALAIGAVVAVLSFLISWQALQATGVLKKPEIGRKDTLIIMSHLPQLH